MQRVHTIRGSATIHAPPPLGLLATSGHTLARIEVPETKTPLLITCKRTHRMEARARAPAGSIPENLDEECAETARFLAAALKHLLRAAAAYSVPTAASCRDSFQ